MDRQEDGGLSRLMDGRMETDHGRSDWKRVPWVPRSSLIQIVSGAKLAGKCKQ